MTAMAVKAAPRKKKHMRVTYGVESTDRQGLTLDLSETGAFICTRHLIEPGTRVRVLIETPGGNLSLEGRVVWACDDAHPARSPHEPGLGIRWENADETYLDFYQLI